MTFSFKSQYPTCERHWEHCYIPPSPSWMCLCMCVCVDLSTCVCTGKWRLEDKITHHSSGALHLSCYVVLFFSDKGSHWSRTFEVDWATVAIQPQGSTCLHLPISTGIQVHVTIPFTLKWVLQMELRHSCLCGKHFTNWLITPPRTLLYFSLWKLEGISHRDFCKTIWKLSINSVINIFSFHNMAWRW